MYIVFTTKRKLITIIALVVILIIATSIIGIGYVSAFGNNQKRQLPIYYVQTERKVVSISFDCAWGTDYTDKLLEVMAKHNVKSTFFAVEFWAKKNAKYLKKISEMGHEIGTHSSTHPYMSKLSRENVIKELSSSREVIESIIEKKINLFRPPYGDYNDQLITTAKELGLYTIQWDVDSLDWKNLSSNDIKNRVVSRVRNGSIVLFHNQGLHTHEALDGIIKELKSKNYEFLPIGQMIYKTDYEMQIDGGQKKITNN